MAAFGGGFAWNFDATGASGLGTGFSTGLLLTGGASPAVSAPVGNSPVVLSTGLIGDVDLCVVVAAAGFATGLRTIFDLVGGGGESEPESAVGAAGFDSILAAGFSGLAEVGIVIEVELGLCTLFGASLDAAAAADVYLGFAGSALSGCGAGLSF